MATGSVNTSNGSSKAEALIEFDNYDSENIKIVEEFKIMASIVALSEPKYHISATSVGNYALFAGGDILDGNTQTTSVDAYDKSLVKIVPDPLLVPKWSLTATNVGDYALFGGGYYDDNTMDTYDTSLTKGILASALSSSGRVGVAASSTIDHALFAGGYRSSQEYTVDVYDISLTRSNGSSLSVARQDAVAISINNCILVAGGKSSQNAITTSHDTVDVYDEYLSRTVLTPMSIGRLEFAATSTNNHALFAGGKNVAASVSQDTNILDIYDSSLIRLSPMELSIKGNLSASSINEYILFAGGINLDFSISDVIELYNSSLVKILSKKLSIPRTNLSSTSIGDYSIFAGGYYRDSNYASINTDVMDACTIGQNPKMILELPLGTKYKFDEHDEEQVAANHSILVNSPASGYIKYKSKTNIIPRTQGIKWNIVEPQLTSYGIGKLGDTYINFNDDGIQYSTDGINWIQTDMINEELYERIYEREFINNKCIIFDFLYKGYVYYSENGIDWIKHTLMNVDLPISDIQYNNDIYISCNNNYSTGIYYSNDGDNWLESNIVNEQILRIFNSNGIWFSNSGNGMLYSTDGMYWLQIDLENLTEFYNVKYANNIWIAIARDGIYSSSNGINWIKQITADIYNPAHIYFEDDIWVVGTGSGIWLSQDSINWVLCNGVEEVYQLHYINNMWIYVAYNGIYYGEYSSEDHIESGIEYSINWNKGNFNTDNEHYEPVDCLFSDNTWLARTCVDGLFYSTDGINWHVTNITDWVEKYWYENNIWIAIVINDESTYESGGSLYYSNDGIVWNLANRYTNIDDNIDNEYDNYNGIIDVSYNNNKWIACSSRVVYYSNDGINWFDANIRNDYISDFEKCYSVNAMYYVLNSDNLYYSSNDVISWKLSDILDDIDSIFDNGKTLLFSMNNGLYSLTNDMNWNKSNVSGHIIKCIYANNKWVVSTEDNGVWESHDGINWVKINIEIDGGFVEIYEYTNGIWNGIDRDLVPYYSVDGFAWTRCTGVAYLDDRPRKSFYINNILFITSSDVGSGSGSTYFSTDNGMTWDKFNIDYIDYIGFLNGIWILSNKDGLFYSHDGINWIVSNITNLGYYGIHSCLYDKANKMWIAYSSFTTLYYSMDGMTWQLLQNDGLRISNYQIYKDIRLIYTSRGVYYSMDNVKWIETDITNQIYSGSHRYLYSNKILLTTDGDNIYYSI